jgi:hypothetical protein
MRPGEDTVLRHGSKCRRRQTGASPSVECVQREVEAFWLAHKVHVGRVTLDEGTHERAERQHYSAGRASLVEGEADEVRREAPSFGTWLQ